MERSSAHFLPEPDRRARHYTIVSADDHVVEPPGLFAERLPRRFAERGPRVVESEDGSQGWLFDGTLIPNIGLNAVVGRPPAEYSRDPVRFDEMRRGAWDVDARVADMDLDGVYASLNFPSFLAGFGGGRLQTTTGDLELARVVVRAWNDWHVEEWAGRHPERLIPAQIPWLHDPVQAADEVRANAGRGVRALTFPEATEQLGLPSLHQRHWDPLWAACQETGTVVCLHTGSGEVLPTPSSEAPRETTAMLFGLVAMFPAIDWLFSLIPVRFPDLRIVLAESGIGWVNAMVDRLDHVARYHECYGDWQGTDLSPSEVFLRNFWFCALDNPSAFTEDSLRRMGPDRVLIETDYPHADSSWPDTQELLGRQLGSLDRGTIERITWRNAAELFDHRVPPAVAEDPEAF